MQLRSGLVLLNGSRHAQHRLMPVSKGMALRIILRRTQQRNDPDA